MFQCELLSMMYDNSHNHASTTITADSVVSATVATVVLSPHLQGPTGDGAQVHCW